MFFPNIKHNKIFALLTTLTHLKRDYREIYEFVGVDGFSSPKILSSGIPFLLPKSKYRGAVFASLLWMLQWGRMNSNVYWGSYFPSVTSKYERHAPVCYFQNSKLQSVYAFTGCEVRKSMWNSCPNTSSSLSEGWMGKKI